MAPQLSKDALSPHDGEEAVFSRDADHPGETKVVLVSFLRDWEFWNGEGRRAVGAGHFATRTGADQLLGY